MVVLKYIVLWIFSVCSPGTALRSAQYIILTELIVHSVLQNIYVRIPFMFTVLKQFMLYFIYALLYSNK